MAGKVTLCFSSDSTGSVIVDINGEVITVKISTSTTLVGKSVSIKIADFSSRGPNSMVPEILKPDVAAPGVNVLAAYAPENVTADTTYAIVSGTVNSVYHASVDAPMGVQVYVVPNVLIFSSTVKKMTYTVTFHSTHKVQGGYFFGSLSWFDGEHDVSSPISVKAEILPSFVD